ncbi:membrane-associated oxidoreductase [Streptomyces sp. HUCO-GS316]|uniref:pentapeptide repeat-containing protein n=1 Tax=Streptomyces sp. HUCO-GS316 TaxID=2692198 RepID=UPI00136EA28F|nr:pentapeptide repeat-containing protein [Streptomyces sp. HUCO-GS316]MXM65571.1 membrane-associated oxidoreductase [Streptomyces sp. HUCO-GS316]
MEINDLTPAEERVWRAFATGAAVDFRTAEDEDPAQGEAWGPERTVRAAVLRFLLLNGPEEQGETASLKLAGARIGGVLDLRYATTERAARLRHCFFDDAPQLYGAHIRHLNLSESVLPGLTAHTVRVDDMLRFTRCRFRGPVRLDGAQVSGSVFMEGAEFAAPDAEEPVLQLNQASVGDDIWAPGLRARGRVRLTGASVGGTVNLSGARLDRPGHTALQAQNLSVGADLLAMQLTVHGRVDLRGIRVPGQVGLAFARLSNPDGMALRASSAVIGELWLHETLPIEGCVDLRRAQIELVQADPGVWPAHVHLDGLTYATLAPHEPAERRLPLLERDDDGYVPYAYEQLTASYRRVGDDHAARLVQLAKQRRLRATRAWYGRVWGYVQDATVGYGFRPLRAAVWLLSLLAIGSIAYGLHHPRALKASEAPEFDPVFYTLDLLLPVISFGQEGAFAPDGWYQTLSYALVIAGWILATTVFTGVTRNVSRQ